jgi:hypothetical protein
MRNWLRRTSRTLAKEDGMASTPILAFFSVLLVLLGLQLGTWYLGNDAANVATQAAYTVARAYESDSAAGIASANQLLDGTGFLTGTNVTINRTVDTVTVTVTGQPVSLIPGLTLPAIERTLTGPIERWVPAP